MAILEMTHSVMPFAPATFEYIISFAFKSVVDATGIPSRISFFLIIGMFTMFPTATARSGA